MFRLMSLQSAIKERRWCGVRHQLLFPRAFCEVQRMTRFPFGNNGDQVGLLHLMCLYNAPRDLVRDVLSIQERLVHQETLTGQDLPLHYAIVGTCLGVTPTNTASIDLLIEKNPAAVMKQSSGGGLFETGMTPLHVAIAYCAPPCLVRLLLAAQNLRNGHGETPYQMLLSERYSLYVGREAELVQVSNLLSPTQPLQRQQAMVPLIAPLPPRLVHNHQEYKHHYDHAYVKGDLQPLQVLAVESIHPNGFPFACMQPPSPLWW